VASKLAANAAALNRFMDWLTSGATSTVEAGRLYPVARIPGTPLFAVDGETTMLPRVFVAKASRYLE
jgi:hypothetical protein